MFRQIKSKLLAAFAVPLAILVAVVGVEASMSLSITNGSKSPHSGDATEAIAFAALGLVGAMIGLVLVIRVSRSVSSSLVDLAQQAEKLATETLPDTVQAILDAGATGDELPEVPEIKVDGVDEVAGVANAIETLKTTALELAVSQAALRRNLADAFVNLGRRNQNLVTRQLEYITEIELKEPDPASLEELFRLDHLATRMRRNAESLLILAGSGPARPWSTSVPVMDVARAASAEVEDYKRLRLHHFDHALVTGAVTTDLVHILAELIENALSFSPPGAPVDVYGRPWRVAMSSWWSTRASGCRPRISRSPTTGSPTAGLKASVPVEKFLAATSATLSPAVSRLAMASPSPSSPLTPGALLPA